jgi:hypothetical protein
MPPQPFRRVRLLALMMLPVLLFGASCASTQFTYLSNSDVGVFLRLPGGYEALPRSFVDNFFTDAASPIEVELYENAQWTEMFRPSDTAVQEVGPGSFVTTAGVSVPLGFISIRGLTIDQQFETSRRSLADIPAEPLPVNALSIYGEVGGPVEVSQVNIAEVNGGFGGTSVTWNEQAAGATTYTTHRRVRLNNPSMSIEVELHVWCSSECFEANRSEIDEIFAALEIEEPK